MATAVPTISAELHGASGYAWISAAYLLANATTAPVWAKLSDIWGRKVFPFERHCLGSIADGSIAHSFNSSNMVFLCVNYLRNGPKHGYTHLRPYTSRNGWRWTHSTCLYCNIRFVQHEVGFHSSVNSPSAQV